MSLKLTKQIKDKLRSTSPSQTIADYEDRYWLTQLGDLEKESEYRDFTELYYDLVTDFYNYGWGESFHFAPRVPGESFSASLVRHEHFLADALKLEPGMVVADLGCGIGGPMLEIARYSGAKIVGVNINAYQLERARRSAQQAALSHLTEFIHCDFLHVDAPDESFDAIYAIEATCCAPDKVSVYGEVVRLLKPGGVFGNYEYCLTDNFDAKDPHHLQIKTDIQLGGGLLDIDYQPTVDDALRTVGFDVLETRDLAVQTGPSVPWYQPLIGSGLSIAGFRRSKLGRWVTHNSLRVMEQLRITPRGSTRVAEALNRCGDAMVEAGRLGIFTPMYFIHARKPE